MIHRSKDIAIVTIIRPYFTAKQCAKWNEQKYGTKQIGSSVDAYILKDTTINYVVLSFPETNTRVKTTRKKIIEYLHDTPTALTVKNEIEVVVIPLSICESVPDDVVYELDINQFK